MKYIKNKIDHRKWKMYLYYNGILIKTLRISENEEPVKNSYVINVWFKKQIFKSNKVQIIVRPKVLLKNNDKKKKTSWGVIFESGIEI